MSRSILHLIDSLEPAAGGPGTLVRAVSREHAQMGHRAAVILLTCPPAKAPEDLEIVDAGTSAQFGRYGYRPGLVGRIREEARRHDAVFVHGVWQYHSVAAWMALSGGLTPFYLFPHGMLDRWSAADHLRHWKKQAYWSLFERHVARGARAVLFTSEAEETRARRTFGAPWRRQELVPLGIPAPPGDAEAQREAFLQRCPELRGRRIMLFLGRLDRKKGCELLTQAFAACAPRDMALVLAGPCGDAAYQAELESAGPVHFPGLLQGDAKWGAFRCAEVFALPSHQENFGIAVAEALACGVPVLISRAVDIHPQVAASGAGLVEPDDLPGTRRLIERWAGLEPGEQAGMRQAAGACFSAHFHIRPCAERMLAVLD